MKKFNFERPVDETSMMNNWQQLIDNTTCQEYDPFAGATPASEGFTNVDQYWGTYSLMGPIVFFSINMHSSSSITWGAGDELHLPIELATRGTGFAQQYGLSFPVTAYGYYPTDVGTGLIQVFASNDGTILQAAFAETGGVAEFNLAGWYFRD